MFRLQIKSDDGSWIDIHPTDGEAYEYDSKRGAERMLWMIQDGPHNADKYRVWEHGQWIDCPECRGLTENCIARCLHGRVWEAFQ
jgi:hypothetical protein